MADLSGIVIRNVKVALDVCERDYDGIAFEKTRKILRTSGLPVNFKPCDFSVFKRSVDARKKEQIYFVYSVFLNLKDKHFTEAQLIKVTEICKKNGFAVINSEGLLLDGACSSFSSRPVVAGFGPCGMFCALILAKAGARPVVIERGDDVDTRTLKVEDYWKRGVLDTESNVQFGEGGAGTFSDGKLLTRINDKYCTYVLETFYKYGADESILKDAKPHIGTDRLREIIKNIRREIIRLGGEIHFNTKLCGMSFDSAGRVVSIDTSNGRIATSSVFLALGHSARDSFMMLLESGFDIRPKAFSVGVRIEHLQENINKSLYGKFYENPALPQGEYAVSCHIEDRAVYSFCMCPGGTVVASASSEGEIVTNGMSYSARDGKNANSAIAVSVRESDYGSNVFGAIEYQSAIERAAFSIAGSDGSAPFMTLGDFLGKTANSDPSDVIPTYTGKLKNCDFRTVFPQYIGNSLEKGISLFEKQIEGFSTSSAILTAPETRTSSPVRIVRSDAFECVSHSGVYPCGEGAGYAGGITSAAVDGIRCALAFISKYKN